MTKRYIRTAKNAFEEFISQNVESEALTPERDKVISAPKFGSSIPSPILDQIIEDSKSPLLSASIDATVNKQRYYSAKVCCPCGLPNGCQPALRYKTSDKDRWTGKWLPTWKEIPGGKNE